jgi:hypothetical protein
MQLAPSAEHPIFLKNGNPEEVRSQRALRLPFFARIVTCLIGMEARASPHCWARELMGRCFKQPDRLWPRPRNGRL